MTFKNLVGLLHPDELVAVVFVGLSVPVHLVGFDFAAIALGDGNHAVEAPEALLLVIVGRVASNLSAIVIVDGDVSHEIQHSLVAAIVGRVAFHRHLNIEIGVILQFFGN